MQNYCNKVKLFSKVKQIWKKVKSFDAILLTPIDFGNNLYKFTNNASENS